MTEKDGKPCPPAGKPSFFRSGRAAVGSTPWILSAVSYQTFSTARPMNGTKKSPLAPIRLESIKSTSFFVPPRLWAWSIIAFGTRTSAAEIAPGDTVPVHAQRMVHLPS